MPGPPKGIPRSRNFEIKNIKLNGNEISGRSLRFGSYSVEMKGGAPTLVRTQKGTGPKEFSQFVKPETHFSRSPNHLELVPLRKETLPPVSRRLSDFLKRWVGLFVRAWRSRPLGPVLMMLPPGGGSPEINTQLVARVKENIRSSLVAVAKRLRENNSQLQRFEVHLNIHRENGNLISQSKAEKLGSTNFFSVSLLVDLNAKQISIFPPETVQAFRSVLQVPDLSVRERSVIEGILEFQNRKIEEKPQEKPVHRLPPPEMQKVARASTSLDLIPLDQDKPSEPEVSNKTLPMPVLEVFPADPSSPAEDLPLQKVPGLESFAPDARKKEDGGTLPLYQNLGKEYPERMQAIESSLKIIAAQAWQNTLFVDRPPLIRFINPPVLHGTLILDGFGDVMGHQLWRPSFSSDGNFASDKTYTSKGSEIRVLLDKDGALLGFREVAGFNLNPVQKWVLDQFIQLPENAERRNVLVQQYPYMIDMLHGRGRGLLLMNFNDVLGAGLNSHGNYESRILLLRTGDAFRWEAFNKNEGEPDGGQTAAVMDAGIMPHVPYFGYNLVRGNLPPAIREILDYVGWKVNAK